MSIPAIERLPAWKSRVRLESGLPLGLNTLHVPYGNQAGAQVFAPVGLAVDAHAAGDERFGVEAGGDVEVGDGRCHHGRSR